ncbi:MAG: glycosyl transferase [Isosphaeraceae bacterium]
MHIFTSVTANYLPKAAALAHSVKRVHPEATFHVVLSDEMPACPPITTAAFDSIINVRELPIDRLPTWIFRHRLVELCTAVKGTAFEYIAERFGAERIFYLDPDIIVSNRLDGLARALDEHTILLTPHQSDPETDLQAILDNEHCCLRHGVYNLGFLAVRMTGQGRQFISWWADRTRRFCYDEVPNGLFTDQRWVDLAPAFFDDIAIIRDPQYNVATWNLTHRRATGRAPFEIQINGRPLVFYHFSGFDSGAQKVMLERYGQHSPVLFELRDWYIDRCEELGQKALCKIPCIYNAFKNGQKITDAHRLLYRSREDLMRAFPDPFDASDPGRSYFHWYEKHGAHAEKEGDPLVKLIRKHAPEPALRLARKARTAWRSWAMGSAT